MTRKEREVGVQSIIPQRYYMPPKVLAMKPLEKSDYNHFFYKARNLSILGLGYILLIAGFFYSQTREGLTLDN